MDRTQLTGVVLAGGRGQRLGGVDKGLLKVAGRPLIERVIERLAPQVGSLIINANRNADTYRRYGYPVIADATDGHEGPLAGIASGLAAAQTEYVLFVPCDAALLPDDLAQRMCAAVDGAAARVCAVHDGVWLHPVCALVPRARLPDLRHWLATGRRDVAGWLQQQGLAMVRYPDRPSVAWSLNTPGDLSRVETLLGTGMPSPDTADAA